jgi:chitin disaccharide deacetylase
MFAAVRTICMARPGNVAGLPSCAARSPDRQIVFHADDLGMNRAVTDGIMRGFEEGLLTSASLLSNAPDAARALDCWRRLEASRAAGRLASQAQREQFADPSQPFDLGIHMNLTQGRPMTGPRYPSELLDSHGCFPGVSSLFRRLQIRGKAMESAISKELTCQLMFALDRGHMPTHLNGHQYIELLPVVKHVVESLLMEFRIPVVRVAWEPSWGQSFTWSGIRTSQWLVGGLKRFYAGRFRRRALACNLSFPDAYFGTMTAGTTNLELVRAALDSTQRFPRLEIALHPGLSPSTGVPAADGWHDPLAHLRPRELKLLRSSELGSILEANRCRLGRL